MARPSAADAFRYRPVEARDRAAIEAILIATGAFTSEEVKVALDLVDLACDPAHPDYRSRVLETPAGEVAGYVLYGRTPFTDSTYDLYWIASHPAHHGDGSGRRLMAEAEREIWERGGKRIMVETAGKASYARTRAFYEKIGYSVAARIPDFYKDGDDRVTYWKRRGG